MKTMRLALTLMFLLAASSLALADSNPPDGGVGVKGGGLSTGITSNSTPITFSNCAGATDSSVVYDCGLFGTGTQAVFAGINETGLPWTYATLQFTVSSPLLESDTVNCFGSPIFNANNCGFTLQAGFSGTVAITFTQKGGIGIGCFDPNPNDGNPWNNLCSQNNNAAYENGSGIIDSGVLQAGATKCPPPAPGFTNVCGPNEFVIGLGITNSDGTGGTFPSDLLQDMSTMTLTVPEPSSLLLLALGLLASLSVGLLRTKVTA